MGRLGSGLPVLGHVLGDDAVAGSDEAAMMMKLEVELLGTNAEAAAKDAKRQMDEMNFMVTAQAGAERQRAPCLTLLPFY